MNDYNAQCEICKIFSNSNRMKILTSLKNKILTVSQIIGVTKLPQSVVSQHLAMMSSKGILEKNKKGSFIHYKIKYPEIMGALSIMEKVKNKIGK